MSTTNFVRKPLIISSFFLIPFHLHAEVNPTGDLDGDGIINSLDFDDDNDGILDTNEKVCSGLKDGNSNTGLQGAYRDNIYWFNWDGSDFANGINVGDTQTFNLPDGTIITAEVTAATANDGNTTDFLPVDMVTWPGSFLKDYYDTANSHEAFYNRDVESVDIEFTMKFTAVRDGIAFSPDLILSDGESTDESRENITAVTNGEPWVAQEVFNTIAATQTTINGTTASWTGTDGSGTGNGLYVFRTNNATDITVTINNSLPDPVDPNKGGTKQGVVFGLWLKCTPKDTDKDGKPDHQDTDADGDGCFDAIEGDGTINETQLDNDGEITGSVDANGIPTTAGSGQSVGVSIVPEKLTITTQPGPSTQTVTIGDSVNYNATGQATLSNTYANGVPNYDGADNSANISHQWYVNDGSGFVSINSATTGASSSLSLNGVTSAMDGNQYKVIMTCQNNACPIESNIVTLNVQQALGSIGGTILSDDNNDSSGDSPLSGVTVELKDSTGAVISTTTTDANGNYTFENVPAGDYTVTEKDPNGYDSVSDTDGGDNNITNVTLNAGESKTGIDFVDKPKAGTVSGTVNADTNGDNSGDSPLSGVTVELKDSTGAIISTTTTDANGNYTFENVPAGDYTVTEKDPNGYDSVSDTDGGDNNITNVTLNAGESKTGIDFVDKPKAGTVSGTVTADTNGDNSGDSPLSGVTVELKDSTGAVISTTTTDANGNYTFENVPAGDYTVTEKDPNGYDSVSDTDGGDNNITNVTLNAGESETGIDFVDKPKTSSNAVADVKSGKTGETVVVDTISNDGDVDPTTVEIIDPKTGNPVDTLTVIGQGVWTKDPNTGEITFTPESGFTGNPTPITYTVQDKNGNTSSATVTVLYPNPSGSAQNDTKAGQIGEAVVVTVLDNDGNNKVPSSVQLINPATNQPTDSVKVPGEGIWTVNTTTGEVTFTPEPSFTNNPTPIDYQVADTNGIVSTATVTVTYPTVASTAAVNDTKSGKTGQPVTVNAISNDGGDKVPNTLVLIDPVTNQPATTVTVVGQGTWTVDTSTGQVTFTPALGFTGNPAPISYVVEDTNGLSSSATITITYPSLSNTSSNNPQPVPTTGLFGLFASFIMMLFITRKRKNKMKQ